jgi:hypothetical protein
MQERSRKVHCLKADAEMISILMHGKALTFLEQAKGLGGPVE